MEPQIGYTSTGKPKFYGQKKSGCGKFAIIGTIVLLLVLAGGGYLIYRAVYAVKDFTEDVKQKMLEGFPDLNGRKDLKPADERFKGDLLDVVIVPNPEGNPRVFILTDASSKYILTQKSPGRYSTGVACKDCKSMNFLFDPYKGDVIKSTEQKFNSIINSSNILYTNGKVYQFTSAYDKNEPTIFVYDAATLERVSDISGFVSSHPELSGGINQIYVNKDDQYASFELKNGENKKLWSPVTDKIYNRESEMFQDIAESSGDKEMALYMMRSDSKDKRETLYRIKGAVKDFVKSGYYGKTNHDNSQFPRGVHDEFTYEKVLDQSYLKGAVFYQDESYAVIAYTDQIAKTCNMLVACVDVKAGKEIWKLEPIDLFVTTRLSKEYDINDARRGFTFRREKDLLLFVSKGYGIMGLDINTGKKLWEYFVYSNN